MLAVMPVKSGLRSYGGLLSLDQVRKEAVQILKEKNNCNSISEWYYLFRKGGNKSADEFIISPDDVQSQVEATQGFVVSGHFRPYCVPNIY